jgi:hypothetical protein
MDGSLEPLGDQAGRVFGVLLISLQPSHVAFDFVGCRLSLFPSVFRVDSEGNPVEDRVDSSGRGDRAGGGRPVDYVDHGRPVDYVDHGRPVDYVDHDTTTTTTTTTSTTTTKAPARPVATTTTTVATTVAPNPVLTRLGQKLAGLVRGHWPIRL